VKLKIIIIGAMRTLADLKPSETGHIRAITGIDGLSQRLAEIGSRRDNRASHPFAPLGDPIQIRIRGFDVALRKHEARRITPDLAS
jgi:ferrous iron transport protein A